MLQCSTPAKTRNQLPPDFPQVKPAFAMTHNALTISDVLRRSHHDAVRDTAAPVPPATSAKVGVEWPISVR